jgi:hypothetical protein
LWLSLCNRLPIAVELTALLVSIKFECSPQDIPANGDLPVSPIVSPPQINDAARS